MTVHQERDVKSSNSFCATGKNIHAKLVFLWNWDFCRFEMFMSASKYLNSFNFKLWTEIWKKNLHFSEACQMKNIWLSELKHVFLCFTFRSTTTFDKRYLHLWMLFKGNWCAILILTTCSLQIRKKIKITRGRLYCSFVVYGHIFI